MALVQVEIFKNRVDAQVDTILVPSETIFKIIPATPNQSLDNDTVGYDNVHRAGFYDPKKENEKDILKIGRRVESLEDYYIRTANPHTRTILVVSHPHGNGSEKTYYQMPQTIEEIAALQPDLMALNVDKTAGDAPKRSTGKLAGTQKSILNLDNV